MKKLLVLFGLMFAIFACSNDCMNVDVPQKNNNENNQGNSNTEDPGKRPTTLQDVVDNANAGDEIDLSKHELTNYTATVNKTLTIKNGSLSSAKLTVTAENVKLEKLTDLSVTSSSRLTINDSKLSSLLIGGNRETSRSRATESEMSLAMVSVTGCEIEKVQLDGFNSQLNITDTATEIDDIFTSTKTKVILEAGSYKGMKDPTVTDDGELTRIDMTKEKVLSILSIYSNPKKTEYEIGEEIDLTGLAVMGTYTASIEIFRSGGWKGEEIESVTKLENQNDYIVEVNENFDTAGVKIVTITSNIETDIKCYFHVYVKDSQNGEIQEPDITDVKVKDLEKVKTSYKIGEKLDLSCYQVVGFCNGFEINLSYTSEPANGTTLTDAGEVTITFCYKGKNIGTKSISVTEPRKIEFYKGIEENEEVLFTQEVADGDSLKLPLEPTREGYTFDGWYNGETKVEADDVVKGNLKLTAKWIAYTYTVKFDANGGNGEMESQDFTYDVEQALRVNTFTLPDYNFAGWVVSLDANTIYTNGGVVKNLINENKGTVTLYAMWTEKDKVSPVFFNFPSEIAIDYGDSIILECGTEGAKIYYTIDDETKEYTDKIVITKDVTITAFATKDGMKDSDVSTASYPLKTYTVTYKSDYDTAPSDVAGLKKGDTLTAEQLPELTTDGYTFDGWYNYETKVGVGYEITESLKLTAKWTINTYKIAYNLNGGTNAESNPKNYTIETKTIMLENPTKTGYAFGGWYNNVSLTGEKITQIANGSVGDITLYAKWLQLYTITYNLNGGTNADRNPASYTVETETIRLADPTKDDNSTFLGWYNESGDKITEIPSETAANITVTARWRTTCIAQDVSSVITSLSGDGPHDIVVTGEIADATIATIKSALDTLVGTNSNAKVNLDLSGTKGSISIGQDAFYDCSSLTSVTIGGNVTSIGIGAFKGCRNLTSVTIGDSVKEIGIVAFFNCSKLESVTIGDSVESIGDYAFYGCSKLTSVTIPDSVTYIGDCAFYNCSSLTSVTFKDTSTWYYTEDENYTGGTGVEVTTDATQNATKLTGTYCAYYWYKAE